MKLSLTHLSATRRAFKPGQKGQSLVEFAIGIVLLLMLVSVVVDGARALFTYLSMRDSAQEGGLYASIHPAVGDDGDTRERVCEASNIIQDLCSTDNPNNGAGFEVNIQPTVSGQRCMGSTGGVAHGIQVTVHYPNFPLTMPLVGMFTGSNTVAITASIKDTIIRPPCE